MCVSSHPWNNVTKLKDLKPSNGGLLVFCLTIVANIWRTTYNVTENWLRQFVILTGDCLANLTVH